MCRVFDKQMHPVGSQKSMMSVEKQIFTPCQLQGRRSQPAPAATFNDEQVQGEVEHAEPADGPDRAGLGTHMSGS